MAYFAELNEDNLVINVISVNNNVCVDENGIEQEDIGISFCEELFGGRWVQTSYNKRIRKKFASIGYTYDLDSDSFIPPKPYPSWVLDENNDWRAPVRLEPGVSGTWDWNEETLSWEKA